MIEVYFTDTHETRLIPAVPCPDDAELWKMIGLETVPMEVAGYAMWTTGAYWTAKPTGEA